MFILNSNNTPEKIEDTTFKDLNMKESDMRAEYMAQQLKSSSDNSEEEMNNE